MAFRASYSRLDKVLRLVWIIVRAVLARTLTKGVGRRWKVLLLRLFGADVALTANVYSSVTIFKPWLLRMDDYACLDSCASCYNTAPVSSGYTALSAQAPTSVQLAMISQMLTAGGGIFGCFVKTLLVLNFSFYD